MKGVFLKLEQGWVIEYIDYQLQRNFISLHPSDHITNKTQRVDGKEVEFDIVREYIDSHTNQVQKYAKLVNHISDISKMVEDDVEKLLNEMGEPDDDFQRSYKVGFEEGYRQAKENTYTEKDMDNYAEYCTTHVLTTQIGHPYLSVKEWLKQPKKD